MTSWLGVANGPRALLGPVGVVLPLVVLVVVLGGTVGVVLAATGVAVVRMVASWLWSRSPGQLVEPTSRWPTIRWTVEPSGAFTVPVAGALFCPSFQPITLPAASSWAAVGATAAGVPPGWCWPRKDTPTLLVLNPAA